MRSPRSPRSEPVPGARSARARARRRTSAPLSAALLGVALAVLAAVGCGSDDSSPDRFDSARAFDLIERQVAFGPRPAGSEASQALGRQLRRELPNYIANKGLRIPREQNSDPALWSRLREAASEVGAEDRFPDAEQGPIIDDHVPFIQAGVPSIDLIDFSYLYADTAQDTVDKLSEAELDAVGETVAELVIAL